MKWRFIYPLLLLALQPSLANQAWSCGIETDVPRNQFDGINQYGHLSYWEKIGDLKLDRDDEKLRLPLIVNFKSVRENASPYLGKGWILAPFVTFVQTGENEYLMSQPNGTNTYFVRDRSKPTLLRGSGTWLAEIRAESITAYASCGWAMQFSSGKLTQIRTPKGRKIDFIYDAERVTRIEDGGVSVLRVDLNIEGDIAILHYGEDSVTIEKRGKRPSVEVINNQPLVVATDPSVSRIITEDGRELIFSYPLSEALEPGFMANGRMLVWDPRSKLLRKDSVGNWTYSIAPGAHARDYSVIKRSNGTDHEGWYRDLAKGEEIWEIGENRTVKAWFNSGPLSGRPRFEQTTNSEGQVIEYKKWSYDEKGRLLRLSKSSEADRTWRYADQSIDVFEGDKLIVQKIYDREGRLIKNIDHKAGTQTAYTYSAEIGDYTATHIDKNHSVTTYTYRKRRLESVVSESISGKKKEFDPGLFFNN